jgi:hypothetical protein
MSVAEWFVLNPLTKKFVLRAPGPNTNVGETHPIAYGLIQNDAFNNFGNVTGHYTWYRLSHYAGITGTQGKELREYLLVSRGVSSDPNAGFQLAIPDNGFNPNYSSAKLLYTGMTVRHPGFSGLTTWNIVFGSSLTYVQFSTSGTVSPNGQSFSSISWASKHTCAIHVYLDLPDLPDVLCFT